MFLRLTAALNILYSSNRLINNDMKKLKEGKMKINFLFILSLIFVTSIFTASVKCQTQTIKQIKNGTILIADFNGDKIADTLTILTNIKVQAFPKEWNKYNPFGEDKPASEEPIAMKFKISGSKKIDLLYDSAYFATPGWIAGEFTFVIVKKGSKTYNEWKKSVKVLNADAIELNTEAGINILLYRSKNKFHVFWPNEEP